MLTGVTAATIIHQKLLAQDIRRAAEASAPALPEGTPLQDNAPPSEADIAEWKNTIHQSYRPTGREITFFLTTGFFTFGAAISGPIVEAAEFITR